ncbi:MAG: hypothetical protein ACJ786_10555 [Catenulispora sp.]
MSISANNPQPAPRHRPISTVRISTVALLGIVVAVAIPAGAAALVLSGSIDRQHSPQVIQVTEPITKIVIADDDGSIHITGDPTMSGVSGTADLNWRGFVNSKPPLEVRQNVSDGVLMLTKNCLRGTDCGGADIDIKVPPNIAVQASTSNADVEVDTVTGGVDLSTQNAAITATGLGSGDATFHTSNGPIDADFAGGPKRIKATTSNAGVTIRTDGKTRYYNNVETSSGQMRQTNVQDRFSDHEIDVSTSNGDVTIK